jgi:DNA repair protein RecN (Recombination protein N)
MLSLARIASGGELSRVMLSLKGALAGKSGSSATSIFDEVDSGIGGAVAEVVGRKLKSVARSRQVICITHLPQVAAYGDCHLRISKKLSNGRTIAGIEMLSGEARKNEIARMLGGEKITGATLAHAEEMLEWSFNRQSTAQSESSKHRASTRSKSQG